MSKTPHVPTRMHSPSNLQPDHIAMDVHFPFQRVAVHPASCLGPGIRRCGFLCHPRDPGSPKLRMVSWYLNTLRFGGDYTPQSSSDKVIGFVGSGVCHDFFVGRSIDEFDDLYLFVTKALIFGLPSTSIFGQPI